ncbi:probable protein phosphatase 2C 73 [Impatiens glandulifera]|uniref:probable protein phosphatase 2C 73 n=1 Tax=Impatiens glandulifera TaxID=253017 RepID=UPI001FB1A043|nr:probable protein phosphatase 2C 73 [Impatiens glandulifera]
MYSQQGRKGVNQDSMTVWENFNGEKDMFFGGVFDGHGPSGHEVSQLVRDTLPSKLSKKSKDKKFILENKDNNMNSSVSEKTFPNDSMHALWEANFLMSFEDLDEKLGDQETVDTYTSGSTAVTVVKQGDNLVVANLGDSRAVLCTRDDNSHLVPIQLTVDLKPNLPDEARRIKSRRGRVFAMEQEPEVFRIWMPEENCPGLAMARAFGDFCLKDFGLISTPQVFHRKLTERDEFVVLATDGIWDVLSNDDVVKIVGSCRKRSLAARLLVEYAVGAWRHKFPTSKTDDCAVVCLFFKEKAIMSKAMSDDLSVVSKGLLELGSVEDHRNLKSDDGLDTVLNLDVKDRSQGMNHRKRMKDGQGLVDVQLVLHKQEPVCRDQT